MEEKVITKTKELMENKVKERDLFSIKNENISFFSSLNSDEKILNIRLFNPRSSLQGTEIEFDVPVRNAKKIKHSKEVIGEIDVINKSILITLRPKEILTLTLSM